MIDKVGISSYELQLRERLNKISPEVYDGIDTITKFPHIIGIEVLTVLVRYACQSQNVGPIMLARNQIKRMPESWVIQYLPEVVEGSISFDDEWEYRRLLELTSEIAPQFLNEYIKKGLESKDDEIRETAEDFLI